MKTTSACLAGLGTTIFAEMSALAHRTGSVNLGQGFPDTDGPADVVEAAVDALRSGHNQYPPGLGIAPLREAIAAHQERWYGLRIDPATEVVVTTGATEAIAGAVLGLVDPGDEIIVLEPYYDSYVAVIQMAGGVRRPVTLRAPDFRLPIDELRAAVTPRTTAILLNSPHNPTGTVLRRAELDAVAAVAIEHDLVVISDEVYEHLTFGVPHIPIATLPGMRERTLTISSGGKSFSFTGWKVGWATGPTELVAATTGAKQFLSYVSGAPLQPAIAHALQSDDAYFAELRTGMQNQRDLLCDGLEAIGFDVFVPEGTYFATTDIRPLGFDDGLDFCRQLPERAGVVAIPHQVFYDNKEAGRPLVRWAFCKQPSVIGEALDRLAGLRPQ
ncbi:MAG TPA: pyridoxal phosphate-dependent aminotransferase [Aeromicrobium sp.]|nr:pyridoxal phosphate-dependent aminotransferase [Aeromicrobium sp.]